MTVVANNVRETTTSTASPLTLLGSAEFGVEFSTVFDQDKPFIFQWNDRAGNFGSCVGHLNVSGQLVIDITQDGDTVIPAGVKQVFVAPGAGNLYPIRTDYLNVRGDSQYITDAYSWGASSTRSGVANRLWLNGFCVLAPVTIDSLGVNILALASSAGDMEIGLYTVNYSDNTYKLLAKTGVIDTSLATGATGYNVSSLAGGPVKLEPNTPYFIVVGSDGNASMRGLNHSVGGNPFMPFMYELRAVGVYITSGWAAGLPASIAAPDHGNTQTNGIYPLAFGVKA